MERRQRQRQRQCPNALTVPDVSGFDLIETVAETVVDLVLRDRFLHFAPLMPASDVVFEVGTGIRHPALDVLVILIIRRYTMSKYRNYSINRVWNNLSIDK